MSKFYWFLGHEQFQPEVLVKHAQLAEQVGFDGVMVSDHFHPWVADSSASGYAFSTLGAIAVSTKKIALMTGVTAPLYRYHPASVAQAAATIDRLSQGRFALGVGTGEKINEVPLGYNFPAYKERSARLKEAVEIMHRLLGGQKLSYQGTYYQTSKAKLYSPPLKPIPIYIAAGGPQTAQLAGQVGDGIITSVRTIEKARSEIIDPARSAAGQKPFLVIASHWSVYGKNQKQAWQAFQPWRGLRAPSRDSATDTEQLQKEADSLPREKLLSSFSFLSSADDYVKAYRPLVKDLKADIVGMESTAVDQEALIRMIGQDVLPRLRQL